MPWSKSISDLSQALERRSMTIGNANKAIVAWGTGKPVPVFCVLALLLLGAVALLAALIFDAFVVPVVVFCIISAISLRGLVQWYPHDVLGACNVVTLCRAALVALLAGAIFVPAAAWAVFGIAISAFALDGVDGWLARRSRLASAFGARFDMEIDAMLGAVLALALLFQGTAGLSILVLGFSRYVFVLAGFIWPSLRGDLPCSFRRKAICVVQIAALIILMFPLTPVALVLPISGIAALALIYSFAVDTLYLLRRGI